MKGQVSSTSWESSIIEGRLSKNLARYTLLLDKLSTLSQVDKLSEVIANDYTEQSKQLNSFVQESQSSLNKQSRKLELQRTDLTTSLTHFHETVGTIASSNTRAKAIHDDIETVDQERALVNKTLQFVKDVRTLKNNISLAHSALKANDYLVAATAIDEIRSLPDKNLIVSEFAKKVVPSSEVPEEPAILIKNWCKELTGLFQEHFMKATRTQDIKELTLMFKMFPMIGQDVLGLDLYSKYVCDIIADESRKIMSNSMENSIKFQGFFSQVLLHLFKIVSTIINDHSKVIATCYGEKHMVHVMEKVEKEADLQASLVLDIFMETRKIDRTISDINDWSHLQKTEDKSKSSNQSDNETDNEAEQSSIISIHDLALLIIEFSQILQNWSMYSRFYSVKWNEFSNLHPDVLQPPSPIAGGKFALKLEQDKIFDDFQALVLNHLHRSFKNSMSLEEMPSLNDLVTTVSLNDHDKNSYPVTSVLDDLILLVRKNLISVVNTGQFKLLSSFLNELVKFFQNQFLVKFMQNKFKLLQSKLTPNISLKKYIPKGEEQSSAYASSRSVSPPASKFSPLSRFTFRGAAASALTNIQSNLQAVVADDEDSILALHHYLVYLNSLYLNKVYVHRLLSIEILEDDSQKILKDNFPFNNEATQLQTLIGNSEKLVLEQTDKLSKWAVKYLFQNILQSKVRNLLASIFVNSISSNSSVSNQNNMSRNNSAGANQKNYIISIEDFEDLSQINSFNSKWNQLITPYKNILHKEAFVELLSNIVNYIVGTLEQRIWTLEFNELGVTKLDRELSLFIGSICGLNYNLREKFLKLTQIVLLLGLDDDSFDLSTDDIKDDFNGTFDWVITSQERIKARNMKIDRRQ
ncbi:Golgi transport complex subunit COG4 SKDI_16G3620 [Saccharomyces kudriavzevii IFO 1802]|uniref:Conserved oligomeric Golgi complex subunit 4 n=1 Tax=Saccharomyces kudriavzevii (strain ATCC MYA-4449 / AS 2.2408 / CBS 8840 / NBRC 1802 / NCYC 2889) TaxID=226230 RepID=A0AA35JAN8_SACK1|nr:uncharacterized protein SKDI_16G3620 [Saccharomyces kudriavzevii IFO 1802]CAI4053965.1 hypothetical protein SKDI_16G3620 [Saccharomyces kudriavzevii IFO 1802]